MKITNIMSTLVLMLFFLGCSKEYEPIYLEDTPTLEGHSAKAGPGLPIGPSRSQPKMYFPSNPVVDLAPFGKVSGHTTTVFNNKLWVIFGNEVWYSDNGANWTKDTSAPNLNAYGHTATIFDNKLWIINGHGSRSEGNEIWYMGLSERWVFFDRSASFPPRTNHATVVFEDKLWVIGGYNRTDRYNMVDVWSSSNGFDWSQARGGLSFAPKGSITATIFDNKIWVIGGSSGGHRSADVSYSGNGTNWSTSSQFFSWFGNSPHHAAAIFNDNLWVIGGYDYSRERCSFWQMGRKNPLLPLRWGKYRSKTREVPFLERRGHTATVFRDKLWIIGGVEFSNPTMPDGSGRKGDIWAIEMR